MRNRIIRFINAYLLKPDGSATSDPGTLEVDIDSGTICWIDARDGHETRAFDALPDGPPRRPVPTEGQYAQVVDVKGGLLSPGLIEVQRGEYGQRSDDESGHSRCACYRSGVTSRVSSDHVSHSTRKL